MTNRDVIALVERRAALWHDLEWASDDRAAVVAAEWAALRKLIVNHLFLTGRPVPYGKGCEVVLTDCKRHYVVVQAGTRNPSTGS